MADATTKMRQEVQEIPSAVDRLLKRGDSAIRDASTALQNLDPTYLISVARGSSDHACTYLKYVSELLLGCPVASVGPSVASVYGASLKLDGAACLSVSQSGQSPDIVEMTRSARADGAMTFALTNNEDSRLAAIADHVLPIHAGPELSVAATKTFINSAVAGLALLAHWKGDSDLIRAIKALPEHLAKAAQLDWPEIRQALTGGSVFTLGRGPVFAISNEAALKFKETCQIHAESYSSAEVLHGPVSIVDRGFPVIAFAAADAGEAPLADIADQIAAKGASVFATTSKVRNATLVEHVRTDHPLCDPLSLLVSFYAMVERVATERGIDPDAPRHLKKVTETI
ncbi:SIS domain-containing protein [Qingshengfaniella alkalisoli]|uniref:SIS domain-containing protein n=1 Tax=Qingshengfaniella alkalisoli TaxID=2599296 RepID=A0A5B8ID23_9RHOB|nr:SIS domain-containing protein [Qingshengfaniella alkalisoli]QDY71536.1 SIS domain-containing protein [Qingshengfaniella alkalisoli]